mmetsp:Transcript_34682/g.90036  ORF Transcript_34682/g.90036 Transcript_34682/m.90036 type:complete len:320 (-) Transcript_34682:171-1130(-)
MASSAAAAANHVVLLEQYVESTMHVPSELQRLLGTIRDLDDKTNTILTEVKADVARCLTLVPQSSWKGQGEQYKEVAELRRKIEDRQRMLVQMGEEKVQLAIQGYALVDKHLAVITQHVKEQEEEEAAVISQEAAPGTSVEAGIIGLVSPSPSILPTPTTARRPPIATPRSNSTKQSEKKVGEKRVRDREKERENRLEREAHREAAAQAAAAGGTTPGPGKPTPAPGEYVVPDAIKNMQPSSLKLQAPGRLLTHADISQELKGRHAELFWPDDNLWYVITIHAINPMAKSADIMYTTGETEELDLNEIVREGHMSLMQI